MTAAERKITPADILSDAEYAKRRDALRKALIAGQEEPPRRGRAPSPPSISRITTRCGCR